MLAARSEDKLNAIAEEIKAAGGEAAVVVSDMTKARCEVLTPLAFVPHLTLVRCRALVEVWQGECRLEKTAVGLIRLPDYPNRCSHFVVAHSADKRPSVSRGTRLVVGCDGQIATETT